MAHHQQTNHDRILAAQGLSSGSFHGPAGTASTGDDELTSDVDEPPDEWIQFTKMKTPSVRNFNTSAGQDYITSPHLARDRKESLLTQAFLSSPELNPIADTETPMLTSDGGLTSPARTTTPSPPLPTAQTGLAIRTSEDHQYQSSGHTPEPAQIVPATSHESSHETDVEAGLGRKRCISFACGRQATSQKSGETSTRTRATAENLARVVSPPKRPCMLKFVCPMKPSRTDSEKSAPKENSPSPAKQSPPHPENKSVNKMPETGTRKHRDSDSTIKSSSPKNVPLLPATLQSRKGKNFNRVDFQKSEATRFFEFGCHFSTEDEWTNEQTAFRQKITVNDTLRKENAIRKLAEEAEEEALEEAEEGVRGDEDEEDDLSDDNKDAISDDGNESDDEEGFADSDGESDNSSDYQFWTPGLTTAATSTDQLEHIRPIARRVASDSSIESTINMKKSSGTRNSEGSHTKFSKMRPGTPDLPDTSDFIVGTVDEDRPLEEAYMSCLEERRRSKHPLVPQDIDPSFPTSEPDADNDDNEEGSEDGVATHAKNAPKRVRGRSEISEDDASPSSKPSMSPPKRLQSPPPKRVSVHRSPPPRRLFGQPIHRLRSPPPMHPRLSSPPSSRRPSFSGSPSMTGIVIDMPHLAQRPNLTHTTSLPRTPNPFWGWHRRCRFPSTDTPSAGTSPKSTDPKRTNSHSRGPIDIVQGLDAKRQRRKDKFWRQHCRTAGKEKHRRCQPGKGAERMRELGLEMADRCRGYGQKAQLVLSI